VEDSFDFIEIDRQTGGFFAQPKMSGRPNEEALDRACRKADEIYVNAAMATAQYEWEQFPKVAKRYQSSLIMQDAREKLGGTGAIQVQFKLLGDAPAGAQMRVAYVAVPEEDLTPIWNTFQKHMKKVKFISPLPVALARAVAEIDKPQENFIVVWVGESSSVLTISSADGVVKMARTVPVGLRQGSMPEDPFEGKMLSDELGKEVFMTSTFFKQEFREAVPGTIYFLGNQNLQPILTENPMPGAPADAHYGLALPVGGLDEGRINENIAQLACLFLKDEFSLLPPEALAGRESDILFRIAVGVLVIAIAGSLFWAFQVVGKTQAMLTAHQAKIDALQKSRVAVVALEKQVNMLKPFEGWKQFYEGTFKNRPAWNMVFSELSMLIPENVILEDFRWPAGGRQVGADTCSIKGKIKAENWALGLDMIRQFGERIQSSPIFEVVNLQYSPENIEKAEKVYDFTINLKIKSRGTGHEA